jgi:hypothetical protein
MMPETPSAAAVASTSELTVRYGMKTVLPA